MTDFYEEDLDCYLMILLSGGQAGRRALAAARAYSPLAGAAAERLWAEMIALGRPLDLDERDPAALAALRRCFGLPLSRVQVDLIQATFAAEWSEWAYQRGAIPSGEAPPLAAGWRRR